MALSGAGRRLKGHRFERYIANLVGTALGREIKRSIRQSRDGGDEPDVIAPHIHIEAKHHKHVPLRASYAQALRDSAANGRGNPVLVWRDDNQPIYTLLPGSTTITPPTLMTKLGLFMKPPFSGLGLPRVRVPG